MKMRLPKTQNSPAIYISNKKPQNHVEEMLEILKQTTA